MLPPDYIDEAGHFVVPGVVAAHREQVISAFCLLGWLQWTLNRDDIQDLWDEEPGIYWPLKPKYHIAAKGYTFTKQ